MKEGCTMKGMLFSKGLWVIQKLLLSSLLMLCFIAKGQFIDDFSDGDFTANPPWFGNTESFVVQNAMLRLNATSAQSQAWLATNSFVVEQTQWEFFVRLSFTPSDNNFPKIYLVSDSEDLNASLNGYFVRIGKTGTDNKRLYFFRQSGHTSTELLAGLSNIASGSNNNIRIKVIRDEAGNWNFWADPLGGYDYQFQGQVQDVVHTQTCVFGVHCTFTSGNINRFYFTDFYVGEIIVDNTPPEVSAYKALSPYLLEIEFSEKVKTTTAQNTAFYFVTGNIGNPVEISAVGGGMQKFLLRFTKPFIPGNAYTLLVQGVEDLAGNVMLPWQGVFSYHDAAAFELLIHEIMADPEPAVGLPPYEYIELFSNSTSPLNLRDWKIKIGNTLRQLPEVVIQPQSYLILCSEAAFPHMALYGQAAIVPGMSTTALTNSGTSLQLLNPSGKTIHTVAYSDTWYAEPAKADGGWSLEMIDPSNPCAGSSNWKASISPYGGTPAAANSVAGQNPDLVQPHVKGICIQNESSIKIRFSEPMDSLSLKTPAAIRINGEAVSPQQLYPSPPFFSEVIVETGFQIVPGMLYTCTFSESLTDCVGNSLAQEQNTSFALHQPLYQDVVFSEIMSNPRPVVQLPDAEYLEIFNRSQLPISLENWKLTIGTTSRTFGCETLEPLSYMIITHEKNAVAMESFGSTISIASMPALPISGTNVMMRDAQGRLISFVSYKDSWIVEPQKQMGGWSLEKIDTENLCESSFNWRASIAPKGGSPGMPNPGSAPNPDNVPASLVRAGFVSPQTVLLFFDKSMDSISLKNRLNYFITGIGNPQSVNILSPALDRVELHLPSEMQNGATYHIKVNNQMGACNLLPLQNITAKVGIPSDTQPMDLIINELLFNPMPGGVNYIELYNRSGKILDLKNHRVSNMDTITGFFSSIKDVSLESFLVFPGEFVVLTTRPEVVKQQYPASYASTFVAMPSLPSLPNTSGTIAVSNLNTLITDRFSYHQSMHFPLITNVKGVALERILPDAPTQQASNWHSASETSGFGTPGYRNSQFAAIESRLKKSIEIKPEVVSPDNDGKDDVLLIHYEFEESGVLLNMRILDSRGRLVRFLEKNHLAGTQGVLFWDGTDENRSKASAGIHILYVEAIWPDNKLEYLKLPFVVASRLR